MPHRGDDARRASGLIRGVLDRVIDLEQQIASSDAIPNLVRRIKERGECTDTVTVSTETVDRLTLDQDSLDDSSKELG